MNATSKVIAVVHLKDSQGGVRHFRPEFSPSSADLLTNGNLIAAAEQLAAIVQEGSNASVTSVTWEVDYAVSSPIAATTDAYQNVDMGCKLFEVNSAGSAQTHSTLPAPVVSIFGPDRQTLDLTATGFPVDWADVLANGLTLGAGTLGVKTGNGEIVDTLEKGRYIFKASKRGQF